MEKEEEENILRLKLVFCEEEKKWRKEWKCLEQGNIFCRSRKTEKGKGKIFGERKYFFDKGKEENIVEKEKLMFLALVMLVAGALMLGFFAHSEGIEARTALKDIHVTLTQAANSL